jgi:hypothetical protein
MEREQRPLSRGLWYVVLNPVLARRSAAVTSSLMCCDRKASINILQRASDEVLGQILN